MLSHTKKFRIFCLSLTLLALSIPMLVSAAESVQAPQNPPSNPNQPAAASNKDGATTPDELFYNFKYGNNSSDTTKIAAVNRIVSSKSWQTVVADIVKILLNISGALTLLAMTISGVLMVTARGNPEEFEKGKKLAIGAVAGLIIIAVSYAVVIGVSELQFFTN